jgi:hypothetical protein
MPYPGHLTLRMEWPLVVRGGALERKKLAGRSAACASARTGPKMTISEARKIMDGWEHRKPGDHPKVLAADKILRAAWAKRQEKHRPSTSFIKPRSAA